MSIEVGWLDNTETIVSQKFDADWTWDEFREASKTAAQLISTQ